MAYDFRNDNTAKAFTLHYPAGTQGSFPVTVLLTIDAEAAGDANAVQVEGSLYAFIQPGSIEMPAPADDDDGE